MQSHPNRPRRKAQVRSRNPSPGISRDLPRNLSRKPGVGLPYGVSRLRGHITAPYQARISVNGANVSIGRYATADEASAAALAARDSAHVAGNRA